MTDQDVKKLKRVELLEMLIEATAENEKLKEQIAQLEQSMAQRQINIDNSGSIAEASLLLSNVFAEAQKSADQYLENIRRQDEESRSRAEELIRTTEEACALKAQQTQESCEALERETAEKCAAQRHETDSACRRYAEETERYCEDMKKQAKDVCSYIEQETREKCIWMEQEARAKCEAMLKEAEERSAVIAATVSEMPAAPDLPQRKSLLGRMFGKK